MSRNAMSRGAAVIVSVLLILAVAVYGDWYTSVQFVWVKGAAPVGSTAQISAASGRFCGIGSHGTARSGSGGGGYETAGLRALATARSAQYISRPTPTYSLF